MKNITIVSLQKNGGGPVDALEISSAMANQNIKHTIIISDKNELKEYFTENINRTVVTVKTSASKKSSLLLHTFCIKRPYILFKEIKKSDPEIIFSPHFHPWLFVVQFFTSLNKKTKWFYGIYESPFWAKGYRGTLEKKLEIWFLKSSNLIVCYSNFIKNNIAKVLPKKEILSVPLGAYKTIYKLSVIHEVVLPEKKSLRVSVVGKREMYKGIETLLESFEILNQENLQFELLIAGMGYLPKNILPKNNLIILDRWLTIAEIGHIYKNSDVIVIPYLNATQSGSPAWAMAAGKALVVTNTGGLPEQVIDGQNGVIVEPQDSKALAEAIKKILLDENLLKRMSSESARLGKEEKSWEASTALIFKNN